MSYINRVIFAKGSSSLSANVERGIVGVVSGVDVLESPEPSRTRKANRENVVSTSLIA
jgi:hypothetical protein